MLKAILKKTLGKDFKDFQQIFEGYDNEVYEITTEKSELLILRLSKGGNTPFLQESWAIEQCRKVGVPVPEILFCGDWEEEENLQEVMIQKRVSGDSLNKILPKLSTLQREKICVEIGEVLQKIHSISVEGFYKRQYDGTWDFPDWESIQKSHISARTTEMPIIWELGFSKAETDQILDWMRLNSEQFAWKNPVLCHGDFMPRHIFVTESGNLSGIIDFGSFQGGAPLLDFVLFANHSTDILPEELLKGYPLPFPKEEFLLRLHLQGIGMHIGYLAYLIQQKKQTRDRVDSEKITRIFSLSADRTL